MTQVEHHIDAAGRIWDKPPQPCCAALAAENDALREQGRVLAQAAVAPDERAFWHGHWLAAWTEMRRLRAELEKLRGLPPGTVKE
jgi:hypothetical protein